MTSITGACVVISKPGSNFVSVQRCQRLQALTGTVAAGNFPEVPEQGGDTPWLTAKHPD